MSILSPVFTRTASDIVAEVLMTRSAFSGAIVLVEGSTDSRFLKRHLLTDDAQIAICGGKQTALVAMQRMAVLPIAGYLAVVDKDFDHHRGVVPGQNIFFTDTHDTETLLLSARLDTVLIEVGDEGKLDRFQAATNGTIASAVLARAEVFSRLRFLNDVHPGFRVSMDAFSPWKYIDVANWLVDEQRLHTDFAAGCGHTYTTLLVLLGSLPSLRSWIDAQGHDVLTILSIGLRQVLGNGKQVSETQLLSSLRLAFSETDFSKTMLYGNFKHGNRQRGYLY
jgi:hypothetical protein